MKQNRSLNGAFPIVAAALGNSLGVKVRVGGCVAQTDGKTITVPAYNQDDPYYMDIAWGYLAHEAAHVRFSDFDEFARAATSPIRKTIVNIIEDIRIENGIIKLYPGAKQTIQKMDEHLFLGNNGQSDKPMAPAAVLSDFMLLRLSADVLGFKCLNDVANEAEAVLEKTFPEGAITRLMALLSDVPFLQNTRDCVRLADRILRMLEEEQEKAEQHEHQDQSQESPPEDTSQPPGQDNDVQDQEQALFSDILSSVLNASEADLPVDRAETIRDILDGQHQACYDEDVELPITREPERNAVLGQELLNKVLGQSARLRLALQSFVQGSQNHRRVHKRSGNQVDGSRLHRLSLGDSRLFVHQAPKQSPNAAFDILIDASGSMIEEVANTGRTRIELAIEAALALALALEAIPGVNPSVTKFPYEDTNDVVPLLRRGQKVRANVAAFLPTTSGYTPLCSALWYVASSVLSAREHRKIIMVLNDGQPDDLDATRSVIRRCEASGIELIGVGIGYDTSHLFSRSIVIHDLSELAVQLFSISRNLLVAA
jgi:nitric oxide reductase activation protein